MIKKISIRKLNKLYELVNMQSRTGLISKSKPFYAEQDNKIFQFTFHQNLGRRGTWLVEPDIEVTYTNDIDLGPYESTKK